MFRCALLALCVYTAAAVNNGLAQTPGLGWNSDYCTQCTKDSVDEHGRFNATGFENEAFIKHIAAFINTTGLQALG